MVRFTISSAHFIVSIGGNKTKKVHKLVTVVSVLFGASFKINNCVLEHDVHTLASSGIIPSKPILSAKYC